MLANDGSLPPGSYVVLSGGPIFHFTRRTGRAELYEHAQPVNIGFAGPRRRRNRT